MFCIWALNRGALSSPIGSKLSELRHPASKYPAKHGEWVTSASPLAISLFKCFEANSKRSWKSKQLLWSFPKIIIQKNNSSPILNFYVKRACWIRNVISKFVTGPWHWLGPLRFNYSVDLRKTCNRMPFCDSIHIPFHELFHFASPQIYKSKSSCLKPIQHFSSLIRNAHHSWILFFRTNVAIINPFG
jgi:hypothetical protein